MCHNFSIENIRFKNFFSKIGACDLKAISIESKIESGDDWAYIEWQRTVKAVEKWLKNQNFDGDVEKEAKSRVKYTLPGPMTIMDCTMDSFYGSDKKKELIDDLIGVINKVIIEKIAILDQHNVMLVS